MINSPSLLQGKRAAIVEDEGPTIMQYRRALTRAGIHVVGLAQNGQTGVDLVLKERPDMVLMDINMPGALNGLEAAEAILEQISVCILMVTAYLDDAYQVRAEHLRIAGYVIKPVTADLLIRSLEAAYAKWEKLQS